MKRQKLAARRPEYAPHHRFCCCACQEMHQLQTLFAKPPTPDARFGARLFLDEMEAVHNGKYGGVLLAHLFD